MPDGTTIEVQAQDTSFSRIGQTTQTMSHLAASEPTVDTIVGSWSGVSRPDVSLQTIQGLSYLSGLFDRPDFETPTSGLYDRTLAIAAAVAQSGPTTARGGTARVGFAVADLLEQTSLNRWREIWQAWVQWAQVTINSVVGYNEINRNYDQQVLVYNEQSIMAQHANIQGLVGFNGQVQARNQAKIQAFAAARHYGTTQMVTQEDVSGAGVQASGASSGFGTSNWR